MYYRWWDSRYFKCYPVRSMRLLLNVGSAVGSSSSAPKKHLKMFGFAERPMKQFFTCYLDKMRFDKKIIGKVYLTK